ncbi:MAG TPA: alkaline phosphatase family protein, partial [Terriglobia bacterium]|nr:alkaline phosphatase family protein [Terriglobia bacterium]
PTNLFGADTALRTAGAHLPTTGQCISESGTTTSIATITLTPFRLDACFDPDHSHLHAWEPTYAGGAMDGACEINGNVPSGCTSACPVPTVTGYCPEYTYVEPSLLSPYFQLAAQYGFANYMFQTSQGPSFPAHQFLFAGTSEPIAPTTAFYRWFAAENLSPGDGSAYGCVADPGAVIEEVDPSDGSESAGYTPPYPAPDNTAGFPCYDHNTLADVLSPQPPPPGNAPDISWKYYTFGTDSLTVQGSLWTAPNAIYHICVPAGGSETEPDVCTGPAFQTGGNVVEDLTLLGDLGVGGTSVAASCNLPQMSWVIPDGNWSDHPGKEGENGGPSWVAAIVNAVGGYDNSGNKLPVQCGYWNNTAILITWDDWGGFYDDVNPAAMSVQNTPNLGYEGTTNGEFYVYGFRVPLLVVSPYSIESYISGANVYPPVCNNQTTYCHDFGSILNFIEYAFGSGGASLGPIGPANWPYADSFVQDLGSQAGPLNAYSLADFFDFNQPLRTFTPITGAKYATTCFTSIQNAENCFPSFPDVPDSD